MKPNIDKEKLQNTDTWCLISVLVLRTVLLCILWSNMLKAASFNKLSKQKI